VLDAIAAGLGKGQMYSARKSGVGGGARWCGSLLVRMLELEEGPATRMVKVWLSSGLLIEQDYDDPIQRKTRKGVFVVDAKRPT
jgi:hypothetical protein